MDEVSAGGQAQAQAQSQAPVQAQSQAQAVQASGGSVAAGGSVAVGEESCYSHWPWGLFHIPEVKLLEEGGAAAGDGAQDGVTAQGAGVVVHPVGTWYMVHRV